MSKNNLILMTDSYKLSHWPQYPKGMTKVYSYMESRPGSKFPYVLFNQLQYYLMEYLEGSVVTMEDVDEANEFSKLHFGSDIFNYEGWKYIVEKLDGRLPVEIKAVKEGTLVPVGNVLLTIENTDPNCYWLTNHLETLLMKLWHPITVATNSFTMKVAIDHFLEKTGSSKDGLAFKMHDFGYRGVSSEESARIGGAAHLINFMGSDTVYANKFINDYYGNGEMKMYSFSVPASEHSVATSYTENGEREYFKNMLDQYPTGIVSIVSDTYDIYNFVDSMTKEFKEEILARDGVVVFRPDSGNPVEVNMKLINILWKRFGGTYTSTGHKLLDPHIRLIQGDGIDLEMVVEILSTADASGWAADNWVFGSGGGLLQKFDRDTQRFAIKASYGEKIVDGELIKFSFAKNPKSDPTKKSKAGKLKLHPTGDFGFITFNSFELSNTEFNGYVDSLETVFINGEIVRKQTFDDVRSTADSYFERADDIYNIIEKLSSELV
jgi:nicotinamide phosphoribosyltransferase